MQFEVPGYRVTELLFNNERTSIKRAIREADGLSVIIKQLVEPFPQPGKLAKFAFGYEILSKFDHPNIIKPIAWVGDRANAHQSPELVPTMILEDQQEIDLFQYLKSFDEKRLPLESFLNIAIQLTEALSVVHYHQVIHKDLHPGNILINPQTGLAQITDFSLSSLLSREQPVLDAPEKLEGVLSYISPEQTGRMNRVVDYRSDFYTLGATFYHLLAGKPPFEAKDALGLVHAHIAKQQEALISLRSDIPPVLSDIVNKMLNKIAEDRYQSALGIKKDLEKIQFAVARNRAVPEFPLAMEDISDRFQIPQKLYGRENEVQLLMQRFFQSASGKPKMLAVAGYSGIGKSALVHEVHKPIATYNGLFCAGKFDQFQKNVPYSALQFALKGWIQHTLSLNEKSLQEKRETLLSTLGQNARVLIDFIQEFELILGTLPEVAKLGADETQNRFLLVFQRFIKIITSERPLVLFIDDIQWADRGTLNLLPLLISEPDCRLLLIVAYRDNEVNDNHPTIQMLARIEADHAAVDDLSRITLGPLGIPEVSQLLQDALQRSRDELQPLVKLVHSKTAGNPFFIGEFLKTLYTEKLLDFDLQSQRWVWDVAEIETKGITDNVVDLMLEKMEQLPEETQAMVQLAACVGSRFDMEMLAKVAELPLIVVTRRLWPALRDGLLLPDGGDWYLGMVELAQEQLPIKTGADHVLSHTLPMSPQCKFLHDRMLQAAYESMSEDKRRHTHLRVGRLMLKHIGDMMTDEECFMIVQQFNKARHLVTSDSEKQILVSLNLRAAKQAMESSVWEAAADYAAVGLALLPDYSWKTYYEETKHLYHIKAESEYLSGNPQVSDTYYDQLFDHLSDELLRADICATRLIQSIGRGEWEKGILIGKLGLSFLGLALPDSCQLAEQLEAEKRKLCSMTDSGLVQIKNLKEMTDPKLLAAMRILPNLAASTDIILNHQLSAYCTFKGCNLILEYGKSDLAAIQLTYYAFYLRRHWQLVTAFEQAQQAKLLAESYAQCREYANCCNIIGSLVWYLKAPLDECVEINKKGAEVGFENGEIARSAMNLCNALFTQVSKSENLAVVASSASKAEDLLAKKSIFHPAANFIRKHCQALSGATEGVAKALDDLTFDSAQLAKIKSSIHFSYLTLYRAQLAFWADEYELALELCKQTQQQQGRLPTATFSVDHLFFLGFLLARKSVDLDPEETKLLELSLHRLAQLNELYAPNFGHKYELLLAELTRHQFDDFQAVCRHYQSAIDSAHKNGFVQFVALANERFADYLLTQRFPSLADPCIRESIYYYRRWGCQAKVNRLKEINDRFLTQLDGRSKTALSPSETINCQETHVLDMASAMKSAQVISSELNVKKLSYKVLEVIVECAGASSAALVIRQEDDFYVSALFGKDQADIPDPLPLVKSKDIPINIVRYVLHSHEIVNIEDVISERAFMDDPYVIANQPRSILCLPVEYRDETIGALYLENNLNVGSFTPDRLDVINLLLAQAAISFDNARLFDRVNQLNQTLEHKVEERTADLASANEKLSLVVKDLELANTELTAFSYSVSHDLRAPLRGIRGFSKALHDGYSARLDENGQGLLQRIIRNGDKMTDLIEGLLELSRIQRRELNCQLVDLSAIVSSLFEEMQERFPRQKVETFCVPGCMVIGDQRMLYSALENLINNAWKYSSKKSISRIEFGFNRVEEEQVPRGVGSLPERLSVGDRVFCIKDNGAGFDVSCANKLFGSFQRLHSEKQFSGTGVGLATVKRVFEKHGGYIWADAKVDEGASFFFMLNT